MHISAVFKPIPPQSGSKSIDGINFSIDGITHKIKMIFPRNSNLLYLVLRMEIKKEKIASELGYIAHEDWTITNRSGKVMYTNLSTSVGGYVNITRNYKKMAVAVVRLFVYQNIGDQLYSTGNIKVINQDKPLTMQNLSFKDISKKPDASVVALKKLSECLDELTEAVVAVRLATGVTIKSFEGVCIPEDLESLKTS